MTHWLFTEEHHRFRERVRQFVAEEVMPYVDEWEQKGETPREFFRRCGECGFLGLKFPAEYGGSDQGYIAEAIFIEELSRCGSGGVAAAIGAHANIAMTPVWKYGNDQQKRKYLAPAIRGEMIAALGITEPNAGSDVAGITTTARRVGDEYILNGSKIFITNGVHADYVCVAAKTDSSRGHRGVSLFIVESRWPGFKVGKSLKKLGWRASDTAELIFEDVRVPAENLLGEENRGFYYIMSNFQWERIWLALSSIAQAERALADARAWLRQRKAEGSSNLCAQRQLLADMAMDVEKARQLTYAALYRYASGKDAVVETTMAKAYAGEMVRRVTDGALQIFAENGWTDDAPAQRYWRDARIQAIGGGTTQIMYEILVKRLGIVSA
ncbi:MAG: acyl-CoA dehydrogenase [Bacillaceae bacterium G1]|nr:acyl-CoA dehydrogenase [Bacillota bacterium]OJF18268.1 MAG: acyl-CoA dehydrogenase [Bacillaceae bacterium G1]